jgi:quercetin dioxygenase-like cupin family protein
MRRGTLVVVCVAAMMMAGVTLKAQDTGKMVFAPAATSKFVNMPGVPKCLTIMVERGDPSAGPSIMLLKMTAGCKVPWHWHTVGEQVMVASGVGKAEMKGMDKAAMVHTGDFLYMPGKNIHQLTAVTAMTLFNAPEGVFDIHYVDKDGNEIPPDQALGTGPKSRGLAPPKSRGLTPPKSGMVAQPKSNMMAMPKSNVQAHPTSNQNQ